MYILKKDYHQAIITYDCFIYFDRCKVDIVFDNGVYKKFAGQAAPTFGVFQA